MAYQVPTIIDHKPNTRWIPLWITDAEVRAIFAGYRITYSETTGYYRREADGVFIRQQKTKEGTLGYVFRNPLDGHNYLWAIGRKNRKPFKLARVS